MTTSRVRDFVRGAVIPLTVHVVVTSNPRVDVLALLDARGSAAMPGLACRRSV